MIQYRWNDQKDFLGFTEVFHVDLTPIIMDQQSEWRGDRLLF